MKNCDITRDLLPLYIDSSCSEDSREFVETHMAECEACRALHDSTGKTVQIILSKQKVTQSFSAFQRRTRIRRILLIILCVMMSLILAAAVAYRPIKNYLSGVLPVRIEPFETEVGRLSDGSIFLAMEYTEEDVFVGNMIWYADPDDEKTLCFEFTHSRFIDWTSPSENSGIRHCFLVITDESAPLYDLEEINTTWLAEGAPFDKAVLKGPDGERILWQEGDVIPDADERAESLLKDFLEDGDLVPVETPSPTAESAQ